VEKPLSRARQMLIGAYFTHEYSLESAALFNPSIVWHPDQSGLAQGCRRFVLSLRATGEGHISSIAFRSGVIDADRRVHIDPPAPFASAPEIAPHSGYDKSVSEQTALEHALSDGLTQALAGGLGDSFSLAEFKAKFRDGLCREQPDSDRHATAQDIFALARANYEAVFASDLALSERVLFPYSATESNGMEDARFVAFHNDDESVIYYATYTAYDGRRIRPQLLETADFCRFRIRTLDGPAVQNKGMALFPHKIDGQYAMISRQDNENLFLMLSEDLYFWQDKELLLPPAFPWEFVQIGNCGPPIETEAGWLVLSHGVGAMHEYVLGAFLLDLNEPSQVIGRLREPLLSPTESERDGYVPNVVYSCGAVVHGRELIIPYAMSDYASSFATVSLDELLRELMA
jgi:predicted GH43/DUF377 family glycosyl hydrolase